MADARPPVNPRLELGRGLRRRLVGPVGELGGDGLLVAVAQDGQLELVAGLALLDGGDHVLHRVDVLALDRDDDVAADPHRPRPDLGLGAAGLDPGLVGGAAFDEVLDEDALVDREVEDLVGLGVMSAPVRPRNAWLTSPSSSRSSTTSLAVSAGTAKPIPMLPWPPAVAIWELIPITSPSASKSGPPELPGLIGASVWIAFVIENPFGESIVRPRAETMPAVAE